MTGCTPTRSRTAGRTEISRSRCRNRTGWESSLAGFSRPTIKIDYNNGKGSGKVLWRLGEGGDLKTDSKDAYPWFSYQHDVGFEPPGGDTLLLLDNGTRHKKKDPKANTRGQLWKIDDKARTPA